METIFTNSENSKTIKSNKFVLNLSHRLDLGISDKLAAVQNYSFIIRGEISENSIRIINLK